MQDVSVAVQYQTDVLNKVAKLALGAAASGISAGSKKDGTQYSIIHIVDVNETNLQKAQAVFSNWGTLTVQTDKTSIAADNADTATITFATLDAEVDYVVTLDGALYSEGSATPSAGTVTLTLATAVAGLYRVTIVRKVINWATGYVEIQAVEA